MVIRAILQIALVAFIFSGFIRADDGPSVPSRKAGIVLPLLKKFSSQDTYSRIEKILGKPDFDIGSGIFVYVFRLDDSTSVSVGTADRNSVFYIQRIGKSINGTQVIFALNKSWAQ